MLADFPAVLLATIRDVLPIAIILVFFQFAILRRRLARWRRALVGMVYVIGGLALFSLRLEHALFPLGRIMAQQLTAPDFIASASAIDGAVAVIWTDYA